LGHRRELVPIGHGASPSTYRRPYFGPPWTDGRGPPRQSTVGAPPVANLGPPRGSQTWPSPVSHGDFAKRSSPFLGINSWFVLVQKYLEFSLVFSSLAPTVIGIYTQSPKAFSNLVFNYFKSEISLV
jgi:hypothetical protein